jgi:hypothetical protein
MKTVRFYGKIQSKKASYVPGDSLRELTAPALGADGVEYSEGTRYRPLCSGFDNIENSDYADLVVQ